MPPAGSKAVNATAPGGKNDVDSYMPLLFAVHGSFVPDFTQMAALDTQFKRTASTFEHRFRTWRQEGRKIALENGLTTSATATPKKGKSASGAVAPVKDGAKKGVGKNGKMDQDNMAAPAIEGEDNDEEEEEEGGADKEDDEEKAARKAKAAAAIPSPSPAKKKRAASKMTKEETGEKAAPAKRAKKGTAQVVKKPSGIRGGSQPPVVVKNESIDESEEQFEEEGPLYEDAGYVDSDPNHFPEEYGDMNFGLV